MYPLPIKWKSVRLGGPAIGISDHQLLGHVDGTGYKMYVGCPVSYLSHF